MTDALAALFEVAPAPLQPCFATGDWNAVEAALGLRLPSDYKRFVNAYGAGRLASLLIHSPFVWMSDGRDVRRAWTGYASMYRDYAKYGGVELPHPVYPEPNGLLPFGSIADVNCLNWLTVGEPEHWPFVLYARDHGFFEVPGLSAVEFLLEALTGRSPLLVRLRLEISQSPRIVFERFTGLRG